MNKVCGIYKITSPTGKIYIGKSVDIYFRWNRYKSLNCRYQPKLYRSFIKHGVDSHVFTIICTAEKEKLNELEVHYISIYSSFKHGLNCTIGGEGTGSGPDHPNYNKKGILSNMYGKKHSQITKDKIGKSVSKSLLGKSRPDISRSKHPNAKTVICESSKKEWGCGKDCWEELYCNKFTYSTFKMMLSGKSRNKTTINYKK